MQIHRLRLQNFRQHADTHIEFGAGLTGIVGPNGSGKTTLLEAIAYAMYGTPAARGTRDSLRRRGAPPRSSVRVELDFGLGAHEYRVIRGLNQAELYQDGEPSPIANSLGAVTDKLTRLLGMTREEFFNTYFTGQKELSVMASMSAPDRARFLSRVLGYERLKVAQDRLKVKRSALKARHELLEAGLRDTAELDAEESQAMIRLADAQEAVAQADAGVAAGKARLAELTPRWEHAQQLRETVLSLDGERRVSEHHVHAAREKFSALDRQLIEALAAQEKLAQLNSQLEPLASLRAERETLEKQAELFAARKAYEVQRQDHQARLKRIQERARLMPAPEALADAENRVQSVKDALQSATVDAEAKRTAWVRDAQEVQTKRQTLLDQYKDVTEQRERILEAGAEGACPTCSRPLGKDYEVVLGLLERQLEAIRNNGNFYRQRIGQLAEAPTEVRAAEQQRDTLEQDAAAAMVEVQRLADLVQERTTLTKEREALEAKLSEVEALLGGSRAAYDEARHHAVRATIEALDPVVLEAERMKVTAERAEGLVAEAERAERELSRREAEVTALAERIAGLGYDEADFKAVHVAMEEGRNAGHEAEKVLVRTRAEYAAAEEAVATVERRRKERHELSRRAKKAGTELLLYHELDRALTDLRTDLNATLRPELSDLASVFLRDLTNGRYSDLELDESYVATILEDGEPKGVISGGEEDVANLALRLAISQMIAERAGQPLSLLVLDEIFGSLDEERRVAVVELLRGLADRFPQVILITHIESVNEGFDRVIRVVLDPSSGVSTVREPAVEDMEHVAA
ncbi:MAG: SMC family ATPase [Gemmatimonadales bacterium]|nr:SMC family ATPase [Gemmatimonadales bacterium]